MIPLTRLRHGDQFFVNPDLFERVDTHVDTVVRLRDGTEYVVCEPAEEIVRRVIEFRAQVIVVASLLESSAFAAPAPADSATSRVVAFPSGELAPEGPSLEETP